MKPLRKAASGSAAVEKTYPALCEPALDEEANNLNAEERREMADRFDVWSAQLRYSADFIDRYQGRENELDANNGDAQLLELAARLEQQAALIRHDLGLTAKPKAAAPRLNFLAEN